MSTFGYNIYLWIMNKSYKFKWKSIRIGEKLKFIDFVNDETEEGEQKYWVMVESKNSDDMTITGPVISIQCGEEYISEGDIVTRLGCYYIMSDREL